VLCLAFFVLATAPALAQQASKTSKWSLEDPAPGMELTVADGQFSIEPQNFSEDITSWMFDASFSDGTRMEQAGKQAAWPITGKLPAKLPAGVATFAIDIDDGFATVSSRMTVLVDDAGHVRPDVNLNFRFLPEPSAGDQVQLHNFQVPEGYTDWNLTIQAVLDGKKKEEWKGTFPFQPQGQWGVAKLSRQLPVGQYDAKLMITGKDKQPITATIRFVKDIDFRYAYFPVHDVLRLFIQDEEPETAKTLEGRTNWHAGIYAKGETDGEATFETSGKLPLPQAGLSLKLPDLPVGKYELRMTVSGERSDSPLVMKRFFEVDTFEWEGNILGKSNALIPPFTPMKVDGKTVSTVLRKHKVGPTGLWDQVSSKKRGLLTGPMRLVVTAGGKTDTATGPGMTFTEIADNRVTGEATWTAGPLTGKSEIGFDYDGLMKLALTLNKTSEKIDAARVEIPLKDKDAYLLHPVTAGLRQHIAGRVPAGEGKVWDSTTLDKRRQGLEGPFVPYIYVGGPERGIAVSAENDKGWIIDRPTPTYNPTSRRMNWRRDAEPQAALELHRNGETLALVMNLVAIPSVIETDRRIVFYLQATPAKPMPEEPHNWRMWWDNSYTETGVSFGMWGGTMYWGALGNVVDLYPEKFDFTWYEKMKASREAAAAGKRGQWDREFLERKLYGYRSLSPERLSSLRAHWKAGLSWAAGTPANTPETTSPRYIIPYTSPRSVGLSNPGFWTYMDQWSTLDIVDPQWGFQPRSTRERPRGIWYETEPIESFADMALFHHKKMYETFSDGIYWDNYFFKPCYVPEEAGGPGWIDGKGVLRPGVNLMAFRNLAKRNAIMMHEMGRRPLAWIHMTNVNVVPILSFATLNYEWEWRDLGRFAEMDLQDRLGVDEDTALILVQSLGLKSGNITVSCDRFRPPTDSGVTREWLQRTVLAVVLPHEIKTHQGGPDALFAQKQMMDFGYGRPECEVRRYWEPNQGISFDGANNHALVLKNGERVLIALGNYGAADDGIAVDFDTADGSEATYDAQRERDQREAAKQQGSKAPARSKEHKAYTFIVKLDGESLGLPEDVKAFHVQGQLPEGKRRGRLEPVRYELKRIAPGQFEMTLRHHDYALILVEEP
jgi:hypothetical protein